MGHLLLCIGKSFSMQVRGHVSGRPMRADVTMDDEALLGCVSPDIAGQLVALLQHLAGLSSTTEESSAGDKAEAKEEAKERAQEGGGAGAGAGAGGEGAGPAKAPPTDEDAQTSQRTWRETLDHFVSGLLRSMPPIVETCR